MRELEVTSDDINDAFEDDSGDEETEANEASINAVENESGITEDDD